jgi:hypothetical protein
VALAITDQLKLIYAETKAKSATAQRPEGSTGFVAKPQVGVIAMDQRNHGYADGKPRSEWGDARAAAAKAVGGLDVNTISTMQRARDVPEVWDKVQRGEFTKVAEVNRALDSTPLARARQSGQPVRQNKVFGVDVLRDVVSNYKNSRQRIQFILRAIGQRDLGDEWREKFPGYLATLKTEMMDLHDEIMETIKEIENA